MNEYQTHTCLKTQNNLWIRWDHAAFLHFKNSAIPFASFCFLVPQCYLELYNEFKPFRKRNSPISLASRCTRFGMPPPWSEILKMTWMSLQQSQQEHRNQPTISEKNTFTVHVHGDCMAPKVIRKLKKHVALEPSPPTPSFETWYKKATLPLFILSKFPLVVTLLPRVAAHHWWCSLGAKCWLVNTQSNGSFTFSVHAGWSGGDIMSWRFLPKS